MVINVEYFWLYFNWLRYLVLVIFCSYGSICVNYIVGLFGEVLFMDDKVWLVKDYFFSKVIEWIFNELVFFGFFVNIVKINIDVLK